MEQEEEARGSGFSFFIVYNKATSAMMSWCQSLCLITQSSLCLTLWKKN